jgi:hypothetical protein
VGKGSEAAQGLPPRRKQCTIKKQKNNPVTPLLFMSEAFASFSVFVLFQVLMLQESNIYTDFLIPDYFKVLQRITLRGQDGGICKAYEKSDKTDRKVIKKITGSGRPPVN